MRLSSASSSPERRRNHQFAPPVDKPITNRPLSLLNPNTFADSPNSSSKMTKSTSVSPQTTPRNSVNGSGKIRMHLTDATSLASFNAEGPGHLQRAGSSQSRSKLFDMTVSIPESDDVASSVRLQMRSQVFQETKVYQDLLSHERKNQTRRIATLLETLSKFTRNPNRVQLGKHKVLIPEAVVIQTPESMFNTDFNSGDLGLTESAKKDPARRKMAEVQKLAVIGKTPYKRYDSLLERSVGFLGRSRSHDQASLQPTGRSITITNSAGTRPRVGTSTWGTAMRWSGSSISNGLGLGKPFESISSKSRKKITSPTSTRPLPPSPSSPIQSRSSSPRQPASPRSDVENRSVASTSKIPSSFDRLFMKSIRTPRTTSSSPPPSQSPSSSPRSRRDSGNNRATRRSSNSSLKSL
jgi:hypothetical protein